MIVRDLNLARTTERRIADQRWESVRLLLADDGMGFSFHITTIEAGSTHTFHYKHHFESVYCVSGTGSIEDLATGETHKIRPGVMYALNLHDRHTLRADEDWFWPVASTRRVTGTEVHREDGSYAPADEPAGEGEAA